MGISEFFSELSKDSDKLSLTGETIAVSCSIFSSSFIILMVSMSLLRVSVSYTHLTLPTKA